MSGIYIITLRAPDGRERTQWAYLPTESVKQDLLARARRNGLEAVLSEELKIKS